MNKLKGTCFALFSVLLLPMAANAEPITRTYNFSVEFGGAIEPDPATGTLTVTFDPDGDDVFGATTATLDSANFAVDGPLVFNFFTAIDTIQVGGALNGLGGVFHNTNDFLLTLRFIASATPTLPATSTFLAQTGFNQTRSVGGSVSIESRTDVGIDISGGTLHECARTGGTSVAFTADVTVSADDAIDFIEWFLNDVSQGFGSAKTILVPLGTHSIKAVLTTVLGATAEDIVVVEIEDTQAPAIGLFFTGKTGNVITEANAQGLTSVQVNYSATDICDSAPAVSAVGGVTVDNGDVLWIVSGSKSTLTLLTDGLQVIVTATDAAGNVSQREETLQIP